MGADDTNWDKDTIQITKAKFFNWEYILEFILLCIVPLPGFDILIKIPQSDLRKHPESHHDNLFGYMEIPYFLSDFILIFMLFRLLEFAEISKGKKTFTDRYS